MKCPYCGLKLTWRYGRLYCSGCRAYFYPKKCEYCGELYLTYKCPRCGSW